MSSQFRSLHPYVCQRLVSLFETLAKRHARLCESLKHTEDLLDEADSDMPDAVSMKTRTLQVVEGLRLETESQVLFKFIAFTQSLHIFSCLFSV